MALSGVSADDRGLLEHWLALQLVTSAESLWAIELDLLASVDAQLSRSVRRQLPATIVASPMDRWISCATSHFDRNVCRPLADLLCFRPIFPAIRTEP